MRWFESPNTYRLPFSASMLMLVRDSTADPSLSLELDVSVDIRGECEWCVSDVARFTEYVCEANALYLLSGRMPEEELERKRQQILDSCTHEQFQPGMARELESGLIRAQASLSATCREYLDGSVNLLPFLSEYPGRLWQDSYGIRLLSVHILEFHRNAADERRVREAVSLTEKSSMVWNRAPFPSAGTSVSSPVFSWICTCGRTNKTKFCPECGAKRSYATWICSCGHRSTARFCTECGTKRPE